MDSRIRSSRHFLVRETSQTSLWTTSPRRSETMATIETLDKMATGRLEEKGEDALDKDFDTRQGKAEAFQDHINREEMMSLSLQNSTEVALDEKMRGQWLMRTSALSEEEIAGIRTVTEGSTGVSAAKTAIQQTIV